MTSLNINLLRGSGQSGKWRGGTVLFTVMSLGLLLKCYVLCLADCCLFISLPVARSAHGATVYNDKLWIFAGYDGNARYVGVSVF